MRTYVSKNMKRYNYLLGEIDSTYHEAFLKMDLSDSAAKVLYTICNEGESCLLSEIRRLSGLSKQTVNSALRNLETEDVLFLEAVSAKTKKVTLTSKGRGLVQKTALRIINIENSIFDSWTTEEVKQYLELTERFSASLREKAKAL